MAKAEPLILIIILMFGEWFGPSLYDATDPILHAGWFDARMVNPSAAFTAIICSFIILRLSWLYHCRLENDRRREDIQRDDEL